MEKWFKPELSNSRFKNWTIAFISR